MIFQTLVIVTGLAIAGWGHLLMHDLLGAGSTWTQLDSHFPPNTQSTPAFAGVAMLIMGGLLVLAPILG